MYYKPAPIWSGEEPCTEQANIYATKCRIVTLNGVSGINGIRK